MPTYAYQHDSRWVERARDENNKKTEAKRGGGRVPPLLQ
jgi:hypothetical protein